MTSDAQDRTLDLTEAAAFLRVHKSTLASMAKARIVPGAKPGRSWVFLESDLVAYLRSHHTPEQSCRSIVAKTVRSGGRPSASKVGPAYVSRLERLIEQRRKGSTTA